MISEDQLQNYIHSQEWHIDVGYGLRYLTEFLMNLELLKAEGVKADDLGFEKQKDESRTISVMDPDSGEVVSKVMDTKDIPTNRDYIAKLEYSGVMRMGDGLCSIGIKTFTEQIYETAQMSNVSGLLVYLETGGGVVTAGNMLNSAISDLKKPVAVISPFLGSAGYMGAAPADLVIAQGDMSQIGSIGTFITVDEKFWENYKENYKNIYSSLSGDKNRVSRAIMEGDDQTVINYLDDRTKDFHKLVERGRGDKLRESSKEETFRGGMFAARSARYRGLVDGIGGTAYALRRLKSTIRSFQKN